MATPEPEAARAPAGFFAKIFLCMLLVPILARGGGFLLESLAGNPRPQSERAVALLLPPLAALASEAYAAGGLPALRRALPAGGAVRLLPASPCHAPGLRAAPIAGAPFCLAAAPPRPPLILGLVPATFRVVLPLLELVIAALLSFVLASLLTRPLTRTRDAALAFAAGDLAARAHSPRPPRWPDEAAELQSAFNRMADRIGAMIAAQKRFIGDVSHELRTPLGRLVLALDLVRRDAPEALHPRLARMEQELDAMAALIRDLLFLATLEGSAGPDRRAPVPLRPLIEAILADLRFEFPDRAAAIALAPGPDTAPEADAAWLRRALENVLRNALFYTPAGTRVDVTVTDIPDAVRITIRDHGPGVPEATLPRLFDPFFRVDEARARRTGGAGLGLAITARALALHGGRISAANAGPGLVVAMEVPV